MKTTIKNEGLMFGLDQPDRVAKALLVSRYVRGTYCSIFKDDLATRAVNKDLEDLPAVGLLTRFMDQIPKGFVACGKLCLIDKEGSEVWNAPDGMFEAPCELEADAFAFYVYDFLLLGELHDEQSPILSERMARFGSVMNCMVKEGVDMTHHTLLRHTPLASASDEQTLGMLKTGGESVGWDGLIIRDDVPFSERAAELLEFN